MVVSSAGAADNTGRRVLILYSYDDSLPWQKLLRQGLLDELARMPLEARPTLFEERVDGGRLGGQAAAEPLEAYLTRKYANVPFDMVMSESLFSAQFLRDHPGMFPGARRYYINTNLSGWAPEDGSHIDVFQLHYEDAVAFIPRVMPKVRRIVMAIDDTPQLAPIIPQLREIVQALPDRISGEIWRDFTYDELERRVAGLSGDTALFYVPVFRDKTGATRPPPETARRLAAVARVPIFTHFDTQMGTGVVGGYLFSAERLGRLMGQIVTGRSVEQIDMAVFQREAFITAFDFPIFERFGLDEGKLPPDSIMLNRPPSLWQAYRWQIISALAAFAVQSALVLALMATLRSRNRAALRLRDSEARFRVLMARAPEAIVVYDVASHFLVDANDKAETLFGCDRATLLAGGTERFYLPEQPDGIDLPTSMRTHIAQALAGEEVVFERAIHNGTGADILCEVRLVTLPSSDEPLLRGSFIDITERKRAEEELRLHKNHLEELVGERTAELEVALTRAEAASRAKSTFLANMSHELRTPLTAVIGFSRLMADDQTLAESQQRNLAIINRSGRHLLTLINDVLALSKIEAGRTTLVEQVADLADLVGEIAEMMRVRAAEKGLIIKVSIAGLPTGVVIDAPKLRQVLLNLLSNAVKFTETGEISLASSGTPTGDGRVRLDFAVSDTGPGIATADLERIFEPFIQGDTPAAHAGTGLGLTISREFVHLMGGDLGVESRPGGGATFRFTVTAPIAEAPVPAVAPVGRVIAAEGAPSERRILIADDTEDIRLLLRNLLAPLGFQLAEVADGLAAVAAVATFRPDLVVMDWRMAGLDGLEAIKRIRSATGGHQPKIAMLTASAFEEHRQIALDAGADVFLRKPFDPDDLYRLLETELGLRFRRREPVLPIGAPANGGELTATDLATLPPPLRLALTEAVREINETKLTAALAAVEGQNPGVAAAIKGLVEGAKFRELFQLLEECRDD